MGTVVSTVTQTHAMHMQLRMTVGLIGVCIYLFTVVHGTG